MAKHFLVAVCLLLVFQVSFSQNKMLVLKATSNRAFIREGKAGGKNNWQLAPEAKPDIYVVKGNLKTRLITFYTDIDSAKFRIKMGEKHDFVVLLNGKDSCFTQIRHELPMQKYLKIFPATHDTIPFEMTRHNNINIKTVLNQKDTLRLMFDTGSSGLVVTQEAILKKTQLLANQEGVLEGKQKPNYRKINPNNHLQIANLVWDSISIYPAKESGHETDGNFGWSLFDGRILELDYDKCIMILHSSLPKVPKGYTKLKIEYTNSLFAIEGTLEIQGKKYKNHFLFDNGAQQALVLDSSLLQAQHIPNNLKILKTLSFTDFLGKVFYTKLINSNQLTLGKLSLQNIPSHLFIPSPEENFHIHILGNDVLKRFNAIFDFQNDCVYLKINSLNNLPFKYAS